MPKTLIAMILLIMNACLLFYGCQPITSQRLAEIYIDQGNASLTQGELNWDFDSFRTYDVNRDVDVNRAITHFTAALKISPDNAEAYANRGFCYSLLNWSERACPDFEMACGLGDCDGLTRSVKVGFCEDRMRSNPDYAQAQTSINREIERID
jgi:tetratricopeptide (TPR) repeat protein